MTLFLAPNDAYGGTNITTKYSPLRDVPLTSAERNQFKDVFRARAQTLADATAFPRDVRFAAAWTNAFDHPATPPMLVVSSNRAGQIAGWLDNVPENFVAGYDNTATFAGGLLPWYAPQRSGRLCYILVHASEYHYYVEQIGERANMLVVGWKFDVNRNALDVVGFGATRFAALKLAEMLGCDKVWVVDDNVVNITGFPAAPDTVETTMNNAALFAIGFDGATELHQQSALTPTRSELRCVPVTYPPGVGAPGLLQQAVLWNIALMNDQPQAGKRLNISPYFVMSKEDVSFGNYLQSEGHATRVITQCSVKKVLAFNDENNLGASGEVAKRRRRLLHMFGENERTLAVERAAGATTLKTFVEENVLTAQNAPAETWDLTQCRAVEQILAMMTEKGYTEDGGFDRGADVTAHRMMASDL